MWRRHQGKSELRWPTFLVHNSKVSYWQLLTGFYNTSPGVSSTRRKLLLMIACTFKVRNCSEGEEIVSKGHTDRSMYFIAL
ncbi:hypothetical protein JG687_00007583 [Phytophthora cactorum]|uniref:Uncharacterized protein n=1 Tax=Phytophthora cactorum TaxID=29920 RepID=A0A8T1UEQ9_9STRA|nr:RmlC-like jelly roll fold [Phytophthora cactorum]KAG6961672.1 hypothetical protein JG687_00007583 [Phytophthora cactorum]